MITSLLHYIFGLPIHMGTHSKVQIVTIVVICTAGGGRYRRSSLSACSRLWVEVGNDDHRYWHTLGGGGGCYLLTRDAGRRGITTIIAICSYSRRSEMADNNDCRY